MSTSVAGTGSASVHRPAQTRGLVNEGRVAELVTQLLYELGEDPRREGLRDTPRRVASMWQNFLSQEAPEATCFPEPTVNGQLVIVSGMSVWSFCEHHMLPMNLLVSIGYLGEDTVVGLSKFGRIAQHFAGRLQVQERFTTQVAEHLTGVIGSEDVAVSVRGEHLCMSMRGVRMERAFTHTVSAQGRLRSDPVLNQQFLTLTAGQSTA
ncbi:GTP cyclohydrolase I FolE [Streptomyces californicus]|uniref:GTP cyclohydrolase I n=1 Tax=Streptomyces californicus TaxID=67351 RepID=UPI0033FEBA33